MMPYRLDSGPTTTVEKILRSPRRPATSDRWSSGFSRSCDREKMPREGGTPAALSLSRVGVPASAGLAIGAGLPRDRVFPRVAAALILVAAILTTRAPATETDTAHDLTLDQAVSDIARVVAKVVKAQGAKELVVNAITDTGDLTHTSGAGVTDKLIEQLRAHGLEPALKSDLQFTGTYAVGEAETDGRRQGFAVARIAFQVRRRNGKVLLDSERDLDLEHQPRVTNPADVQVLGGGTVFLPPSAPAGENDKKVLDGLDNKPGLFEIDGPRVRPKGAPYAIEMLVAKSTGDSSTSPPRAAFHPRDVKERQGFPFLKVEPGEVVAVRIINEADHDVASTVAIDGLSMFTFRDDKAGKNEHVVIGAHSFGDILGWFQNAKTSRVFLVSDLPKDHPKAAFLKNPAKIGSITVTFAAAWEKDSQKPNDEPITNQATEIVPGAPIDAPYKTVKRHIGVLRAAVTVRYDK